MKNAIVIIGALSSIGKEVIKMVEKCYDVLILTETPEKEKNLKLYAEEFFNDNECKIIETRSLDITDCKQIKDVFNEKILSNYKITSLIYLAGTNNILPAIEVTEESWDNVINVNLKGFFFTAQLMGGEMIKNGGGSIVSIASQHGVVPNYNRGAYCASKAALIHLSKELALEWAKYKIRVNTVSPTFIENESNVESFSSRTLRKKWLDSIPLHSYATPKDVASAIAFLNSEENKMITGHNLVVDGGWILNR